MLYRICDQLVTLVRFRHLNGNLKLAGSGDGIDLWGVSWWHTTLAVSGRWGWFTGMCHGGARLNPGDRIDMWGHAMGRTSLAGSGRWHWIMGTRDTGWSRAMGLIYGSVWHWLERGDGIDSGGLPWGTRHWLDQGDGLIYGGVPWGMQHGLDRGDGIDLWGISWGHTTGSGRWDWFEGAHHCDVMLAGTCHRGATGSERWDWIVGARHGGAILAGCELWDWFIGVFHGGRNWIGEMELICGGEPWGRMTLARSGWGDWFMWARHEGATLAGLGLLDWSMGVCRMAKYYMVAECKWQSTIWLLNVKWRYHVSYVSYVWHWGKCAECVWLWVW